jgi:uncharacterized protein Usg
MKKKNGLILPPGTGNNQADDDAKTSVPLIRPDAINSSIPIFQPRAQSMTEAEILALLEREPVDGDAMGSLSERLGGMIADVNRLARAQDDAKRFTALVKEAARKGPAHRERVMRMAGCRLTLAKILFWLPDHQHILQTFVWQDLDAAPKFPMLAGFIEWWNRELDGKVHEVHVSASKIFTVSELEVAASATGLN